MSLQYDIVLFDFDGTLADSQHAIVFCMEKAFEEHGMSVPEHEEMIRCIGIPIRETFMKLGKGRVSPELAESMASAYSGHWFGGGKDLVTLFPGAHECLQQLASMPLRVGLVSNKKQRGVDDAVSVFGLSEVVDMAIGAREGLEHKPHVDFFTKAVQPHCKEISIERILMVGDAEPDLLFAANVGMHACWARYGYGHPDRCSQLSPKFTLENIALLPEMLLSA